ncbi:MAG: response regulator [Candidatus Omnitrophica bacterium]|nr:response regulator [Candidatus Omnitrophota bacterium]
MNKNTLTTYEIAEHCQVTPRTAIQWINEGKLKAFRTPGNHSRVTHDEFLNFLRKFEIPVPEQFLHLVKTDKKRVLIVDDDKSMVKVIKNFFIKEKIYDLEVAYDGFEAGEKFVSFKPDLIILDIRMPGLDGYKVCSRIRSNPENKKVRIFFISGTMDPETVDRITKLGADGYLLKPFKINELKTKVTALFEEKGEL